MPASANRRNRNTPVHDWIEVYDVPFEDAPPFPTYRAVSDNTKRWWDNIRTMPHCVLWKPSDWQFAMDTALLHDSMMSGASNLASEMRLREKVLGATLEARKALGIRYVEPDRTAEQAVEGDGATVTEIDPRRRRAFGGA